MLVKALVKLVRSVATPRARLPKASPCGTFSEGPRSHNKFRYLIGVSLPLVLWGCQTDDPVVGPQPQPALNLT